MGMESLHLWPLWKKNLTGSFPPVWPFTMEESVQIDELPLTFIPHCPRFLPTFDLDHNGWNRVLHSASLASEHKCCMEGERQREEDRQAFDPPSPPTPWANVPPPLSLFASYPLKLWSSFNKRMGNRFQKSKQISALFHIGHLHPLSLFHLSSNRKLGWTSEFNTSFIYGVV